MARRKEPHSSLDYFPTPAWATRALCEHLGGREALGDLVTWEPACGDGHMVRPLREYFRDVYASDVHCYDGQHEVHDFLWSSRRRADWIVTNPPFRLADQFAATALRRAEHGVALLVRLAFVEGRERHEMLFRKTPPARILQFVERVAMVKGRVDPEASSATAYCWIVWRTGKAGPTRFEWIAPCRTRLEETGDYAAAPAEPLGGMFA